MPDDKTFQASLTMDDRDYTKKMASAGLTALQLGGFAVAGAAIAATAYVQLSRRAIAMGTDIVQGSYKIGASVKDMQTVGMLAKLTGADLGGLGAAYRRLNEIWAMGDKRGSAMGNTVRDLGLDMAELNKLTPEERFKKLLVAIAAIEDPIKKLEALRGVFGGQAEGAYPLVQRDPKELAGVFAQAVNAPKMGGREAREAEQAQQGMKLLGAEAWSVFRKGMGVPAVTAAMSGLSRGAPAEGAVDAYRKLALSPPGMIGIWVQILARLTEIATAVKD